MIKIKLNRVCKKSKNKYLTLCVMNRKNTIFGYYEKEGIMVTLSKEHKSIFEDNVKRITPKDEQKVLTHIDDELEKLQEVLNNKPSAKIKGLIKQAELLLEILRAEDFPITESSRKWVVFGLNYLISDFDLIPDSIPVIGYLDDALVMAWVTNLIDNDITRYSIYKKAKNISAKDHVIKQILQGDGHTEVILIPGFLSSEFYSDNYKKWIQQVKQSNLGGEKTGISVFDWKTNYTPEFHNTILMVDHDMSLKPKYDSSIFAVDWLQLKIDYTNLSKAFFANLEAMKKQYPNKKIILLTLNIGTFVIDNPKYSDKLHLIDDYYIFGGCSQAHYISENVSKEITNIYNFYNPHDAALGFVFENFEDMEKPIGMAAIYTRENSKLKNISIGNHHRRHAEYKEYLTDLIDSI